MYSSFNGVTVKPRHLADVPEDKFEHLLQSETLIVKVNELVFVLCCTDLACDASRTADVAAIIMQEGDSTLSCLCQPLLISPQALLMSALLPRA